MKRTSEPYNINTKTWWNGIYSDEYKRREYEVAAVSKMFYNTDMGLAVDHTQRFIRANQEVKDGDKVLDVGCGIGNFATLVKKTHPKCEVWGTDISDVVIKDNKKADPDIKYLHQYIGNPGNLPDDYFNLIFCGETIEHLDNPEILFVEAHNALKTGGRLVITTPLEGHIKSKEHMWTFDKEDIRKLYEDNGFKDVEFIDLPDLEHTFVIFAIGAKK